MAGGEGQSPCQWTAPTWPSWATRDAWQQDAAEAGKKANVAKGKAPKSAGHGNAVVSIYWW